MKINGLLKNSLLLLITVMILMSGNDLLNWIVLIVFVALKFVIVPREKGYTEESIVEMLKANPVSSVMYLLFSGILLIALLTASTGLLNLSIIMFVIIIIYEVIQGK